MIYSEISNLAVDTTTNAEYADARAAEYAENNLIQNLDQFLSVLSVPFLSVLSVRGCDLLIPH